MECKNNDVKAHACRTSSDCTALGVEPGMQSHVFTYTVIRNNIYFVVGLHTRMRITGRFKGYFLSVHMAEVVRGHLQTIFGKINVIVTLWGEGS